MYELSKTALEYYRVLPQIVEKLGALKYLHEQSAGLVNRIADVEQMQTTINTSLKEAGELLDGVKVSMATNLQTLQANLASLDERLHKLAPS